MTIQQRIVAVKARFDSAPRGVLVTAQMDSLIAMTKELQLSNEELEEHVGLMEVFVDELHT